VLSLVVLVAVATVLLLVGPAHRALARSLTLTVARARLSGWCACAGRFIRHQLPAVSSPLGGRVTSTAGPVSPTTGPAVPHRDRAR
jgi:hypothetical protein